LRAETELFDYQLGYVTEWEIAKIRGDGEWGIIELIPIINGQIVPGDGDILLARFQEDEWKIATPKSPEFPDWLQRIPNTLLIPYPERNVFLTPDSPSESTSGLYKLPFSCGVQAKVTRAGSDHDNAIDFLIGAGSGGNDVVVAAQGGWVHRIDQNHTACCCDSSYQANRVILRHPNGEYSYYVHIAANSVVVSLNQWVEQGQAIATEGDVGYSCASLGGGCATRYCEIPDSILDYCCEHLHFEVRDNGHYGGSRLNPRFSDVSGEHVRSEGTYTSGNCGDTDPPTINFTTPDQNQWYNTDQTLSWSITDDDSGVDYYKWAWDDSSPDTKVNGSSGSTKLSVAGQGQHTLYVQAWDEEGNATSVQSRGWFGYDTVKPNVPTIHPGCLASHSQWQNTCRDPNFSWAATDPDGSAGSGVSEYAYLWGDSNTGDPTTWTADTRYDPPPIADEDDWAQYYLHVKAKDRAGNVSNVSTFGLWYDGVPPTATIAINNSAATAHQTTVQVHLSAGDVGSGVAEVRLSHNGFAWSAWQPYADVVAWGLPALNRRDVPVYAQVRDRAGNLSPVVSDTIMLDLYPVAPHSDAFRICNDVLNTAGQAGLASTTYSLVSSVGSPWSVDIQPGTMMWFPGATGFLATTACRPITRTVTDDFTLHRWVIASGGNLRSSAGFRLGDTAGQPAASGTNAFSSTSYILSSGFWGHIIEPTCDVPLRDISIDGPIGVSGSLYIDKLYTFQAVITPTEASEPITYTWSPDPVSEPLTGTAMYQWGLTDTYIITLTAKNCGGPVTTTREIRIWERDEHFIYLPLVLRQ